MPEPVKTENTDKHEDDEEVQSDLLHELPDWPQEFREKLVDESSSLEPREETLPVLLTNYQWIREQKWNRVRVSTVHKRTFRRTQIVISA